MGVRGKRWKVTSRGLTGTYLRKLLLFMQVQENSKIWELELNS